MSHRLPAHPVDKWVARIDDSWPQVARGLDAMPDDRYLDPGDEKAIDEAAKQRYFATVSIAVEMAQAARPDLDVYGMVGEDPEGFSSLLALLSYVAGMPSITDIFTYADWQKSRQVYEFDADFVSELDASDGLMGLSIADLAQRRPARCFYVAAPLPDHTSPDKGSVKQVGFFSDVVWMPFMRDGAPQMAPQMILTTIDSSGAMVDMHALSLDLPTIEDMLEDEIGALEDHGFSPAGGAVVDIDGRYVNKIDADPAAQAQSKDEALKTIKCALSCLAYLGSYEPEVVQTAPTPRLKRQTRAGYAGQTPRLVVGSTIGAVIRRYNSQQATQTQGSGTTMRPHLRRAHWSHYWVGSHGSAERHVEPRWISPILVNAELGRIATTVHKVRSDSQDGR